MRLLLFALALNSLYIVLHHSQFGLLFNSRVLSILPLNMFVFMHFSRETNYYARSLEFPNKPCLLYQWPLCFSLFYFQHVPMGVVYVMLLLPQIGRRGPSSSQQRSAAALSPLLVRAVTKTSRRVPLNAVLRTTIALLMLVSRPSFARGE